MKAKPTHTIRFTHSLTKLSWIKKNHPVTLLHASKTNLSKLSGAFLRYDTRFATRAGYFNLEGLDHIILLLFEDIEGTLFSTIRSFSPDKFKYYSDLVGSQFAIEVKEEQQHKTHSRPPRLKDFFSKP